MTRILLSLVFSLVSLPAPIAQPVVVKVAPQKKLTARQQARIATARSWRSQMAPMPAAVRDALVRSSQEDLGAAWRRIDSACARADGDRRWSYNALDYLRREGLSAQEAQTVVDWIWPT